MTSESSAVFRFGAFRLDAAHHRLERGGELLTIPPKAFQLLVILVKRAGALITKEELIDTLWPDVVVQENNLTQQVSFLRKLLGEKDWIETVPRLGYRFVGELQVAQPEERAVPPPAEPGRRHRIVAAAAAVLAIAGIGAAILTRANTGSDSAPRIRSLAVLPLRPLGPPQETEHLAVGVADAVIYQLSALQSVQVRPTSSVRKYAGSSYDSRRAARELDVDAVVEGTIQREADRIRIRVQLVDVNRNTPLFSGKFDEPASDLFALEDVVAGAIARALTVETTFSDTKQAKKRRSREPGAYEAYLKGKFEWSKRTPDSLKASIAHYSEAIDRDPSYAAAYAGLGESFNWLSMHRVVTPKEAFPRAKEAAAQALSMDESLADAHVTLGTAAFYYDWDFLTAEKHLRRAIALDPAQSSARHVLANVMIATGRSDEAIRTMAEARRRDPLSLTLTSISAYQLYLARRPAEGIRLARMAIDRDSNFANARWVLSGLYTLVGRQEEAVAEIERASRTIGEDTYILADLAAIYGQYPPRRDQARALEPRLLRMYERGTVSPFDLVRYYSALGRRDDAFRMLEETMKRRDPGMVWIAVDPQLDGLRADPRLQRFLIAMKLDEVRIPGD